MAGFQSRPRLKAKKFRCPYCNRERSGLKGTPEEQTREHIIPQSISGEWTINVCSGCNNLLGAGLDKSLAEVCWLEKFYRSGRIMTRGLVVMKGGRVEVPAHLEIQEEDESSRGGRSKLHLHSCRLCDSGRQVERGDIEAAVITLQSADALDGVDSVIAKIALGGIVYAARPHRCYPTVERLVDSPILDNVRKVFFGCEPPAARSGYRAGVTISRICLPRCQEIQDDHSHPEVRRHAFRARQSGNDIVLTIVLFSALFYEVVLSGPRLGVDELYVESLLESHKRIDPVVIAERAVGADMWRREPISIHIAL